MDNLNDYSHTYLHQNRRHQRNDHYLQIDKVLAEQENFLNEQQFLNTLT